MQLKIIIAFSFQLLAFSLVSAAWQESAFGPPWCSTTGGIGCSLPINVSDKAQTKTGSLYINNFLSVSQTSKIFAGKLGIGPGAVTVFDPSAVLDMDDKVRIRGGVPAVNKILTSDSTGLAQWQLYDSITTLYSGNGITLSPSLTIMPPSTSGIISIDDAYTQRRVSNTCPLGQEMYTISLTGVASCRPATISLTAGTGLTATPANPITNAGTISINPAVTQQRVSDTCAGGQIISAIAQDGTVTCRADTTYNLTSGTGITLTPNPITNTGTVAINPAVTQQRVSGTCVIGQTISAIAQDGTVTCRAGIVSLTPGTGITLTPNPITNTGTIGINPLVTQQRVIESCPTGVIAKIYENGEVQCRTGGGLVEG